MRAAKSSLSPWQSLLERPDRSRDAPSEEAVGDGDRRRESFATTAGSADEQRTGSHTSSHVGSPLIHEAGIPRVMSDIALADRLPVSGAGAVPRGEVGTGQSSTLTIRMRRARMALHRAQAPMTRVLIAQKRGQHQHPHPQSGSSADLVGLEQLLRALAVPASRQLRTDAESVSSLARSGEGASLPRDASRRRNSTGTAVPLEVLESSAELVQRRSSTAAQAADSVATQPSMELAPRVELPTLAMGVSSPPARSILKGATPIGNLHGVASRRLSDVTSRDMAVPANEGLPLTSPSSGVRRLRAATQLQVDPSSAHDAVLGGVDDAGSAALLPTVYEKRTMSLLRAMEAPAPLALRAASHHASSSPPPTSPQPHATGRSSHPAALGLVPAISSVSLAESAVTALGGEDGEGTGGFATPRGGPADDDEVDDGSVDGERRPSSGTAAAVPARRRRVREAELWGMADAPEFTPAIWRAVAARRSAGDLTVQVRRASGAERVGSRSQLAGKESAEGELSMQDAPMSASRARAARVSAVISESLVWRQALASSAYWQTEHEQAPADTVTDAAIALREPERRVSAPLSVGHESEMTAVGASSHPSDAAWPAQREGVVRGRRGGRRPSLTNSHAVGVLRLASSQSSSLPAAAAQAHEVRPDALVAAFPSMAALQASIPELAPESLVSAGAAGRVVRVWASLCGGNWRSVYEHLLPDAPQAATGAPVLIPAEAARHLADPRLRLLVGIALWQRSGAGTRRPAAPTPAVPRLCGLLTGWVGASPYVVLAAAMPAGAIPRPVSSASSTGSSPSTGITHLLTASDGELTRSASLQLVQGVMPLLSPGMEGSVPPAVSHDVGESVSMLSLADGVAAGTEPSNAVGVDATAPPSGQPALPSDSGNGGGLLGALWSVFGSRRAGTEAAPAVPTAGAAALPAELAPVTAVDVESATETAAADAPTSASMEPAEAQLVGSSDSSSRRDRSASATAILVGSSVDRVPSRTSSEEASARGDTTLDAAAAADVDGARLAYPGPSSRASSPAAEVQPARSASISSESSAQSGGSGPVRRPRPMRAVEVASLRPSNEELTLMGLRLGMNEMRFRVDETGAEVEARLFLWTPHTKVVVSDVDGTITKSDVLGHVMYFIGADWTQEGVASLFSNIHRNGYEIVYLTSRAIGQVSATKNYLDNITQTVDARASSESEGGAAAQHMAKLPDGPVITSPDRLFTAFTREVIKRQPQEFKIAALRDIAQLWPSGTLPFYAGFGNRETDTLSYTTVGVPPERIFIIDPRGDIRNADRIFAKTYAGMNAIVDQVFPSLVDADSASDGAAAAAVAAASVASAAAGELDQDSAADVAVLSPGAATAETVLDPQYHDAQYWSDASRRRIVE